MDQGALVMDEIDEGAKLIRGIHAFLPVKVAFWLKRSDDDTRHLHVASDAVTDDNLLDCYRQLVRIANINDSVSFDPFVQVKLVPGDDPLAMAAYAVNQRYPGRVATRYGGSSFGGVTVDDVYIYPSTVTSAAESRG